MRLKKFNLFEKREGFDDIYDNDDYNYDFDGNEYDGEYEDDLDDNYQDDSEGNDDMETLCSLIRQMFEYVDVEYKDLNISISVQFNNKGESLKNVIKSFDVARKIRNSVLAQYESSFELWETKNKKSTIISFDFDLEDKQSSSSTGYRQDTDDDYPW